MSGSVLHLRRHIPGCCSNLSSYYILVPVHSMSFAYICSVTVLFPQVFILVFQLLFSHAGFRVHTSTLLKRFMSPVSPLMSPAHVPAGVGYSSLCVCVKCMWVAPGSSLSTSLDRFVGFFKIHHPFINLSSDLLENTGAERHDNCHSFERQTHCEQLVPSCIRLLFLPKSLSRQQVPPMSSGKQEVQCLHGFYYGSCVRWSSFCMPAMLTGVNM